MGRTAEERKLRVPPLPARPNNDSAFSAESPSADGRGHLAHGEPAMGKRSPGRNSPAPEGRHRVKWGPDIAPTGLKMLFVAPLFCGRPVREVISRSGPPILPVQWRPRSKSGSRWRPRAGRLVELVVSKAGIAEEANHCSRRLVVRPRASRKRSRMASGIG